MSTLQTQTDWRLTHNPDGAAIQGKFGVISSYQDGDLDVLVTNLRVARRMERASWKVRNHYDDGAAFIRPPTDLNQSARLIKARKRRTISQEVRLAMSQRLQQWAFRKKQPPINAPTATESLKTVLEPQVAV